MILPRRHRHHPLLKGTLSLPFLKGQPNFRVCTQWLDFSSCRLALFYFSSITISHLTISLTMNILFGLTSTSV